MVFVLRALAWVYYLLPDGARRSLGHGIGKLLYWKKLRQGVVRQNLEYAYPDDPALRERLVAESYRHLGQLGLEVLLLFGPMRRFGQKRLDVVGGENWQKAHALGKGVLVMSSHVGNWEVMAAGSAQSRALAPIDMMLVTKRLKPAWLHAAVEKGRRAAGVRATYEPRTLKDVLAHLKAGGSVGVVLDQYAGPPVGLRVPFFGVPVSTPSLVALLARRTGAPVLPAVNYRLPDGGFRLEVRPALEWIPREDAGEELGVNTAYYSEIIEKDIRNHPEQWLWTHRRFKGDLTPLREGEWREGRARR